MKKLLVASMALIIAACTSRIGSDEYNVNHVGTVGQARECVVLSVRKVNVASDSNTAGTLLGAGAGGVAGSMIGGTDRANILGAIGGAAIGGIAGNASQGYLSSQDGYEYVVRLLDGSGVVTVTQGNDVIMTQGEKCLLLYGQRSRVIPAGY
jgi:outer membrane lipoprotein SlyB